MTAPGSAGERMILGQDDTATRGLEAIFDSATTRTILAEV
jgi:hypothetical protein